MEYIEVKPAYGRQYTNQKQIKEDWAKNLDFRMVTFGGNGPYVNKADAERNNLKVIVRYGKNLEKVFAVN
jgi:hypothetical protein